jgi:hypothetical protein
MADRTLSTSRRALLGAAAALPLTVIARSAATKQSTPAASEAALDCRAAAQQQFTLSDAAGGVEGLAMTWNARLTRYRHLFARATAAAETGWFRAANDRYNREYADPGAERKAAFARVSRAEDLYWRRCTDPMQQAALVLIQTPPPDLEALREKIAIIRTHHLHDPDDEARDCFKVIEEDVGRLARR